MEIRIRAFDETCGEFAFSHDHENENYFWGFDGNGQIACYYEVEKRGNSEFDPPEIVPEEVSGPYELWSTVQDYEDMDLYEGDRVEIGLANGQTIKAEIKFIDGCFEVQAKDFCFRRPGIKSNRNYLKCYTINHTVKKIGTIHDPEKEAP